MLPYGANVFFAVRIFAVGGFRYFNVSNIFIYLGCPQSLYLGLKSRIRHRHILKTSRGVTFDLDLFASKDIYKCVDMDMMLASLNWRQRIHVMWLRQQEHHS